MSTNPAKVGFLAVFWTLIIAVPLTALALSLVAFTTDHYIEIANAAVSFGRSISVGGRGFVTEFSARWPEVAGMVIGQLVIMIILLLVRRENQAQSNNK
jgi:hypothetical protein